MLTAVAVVLPQPALAQVVLHIEGQDAGKIRAGLSSAAPPGLIFVDQETFAASFGKPKLGDKLFSGKKRKALAKALTAVGKQLNAVLLVVGLSKGGKLILVAVNPAKGKVVLDKSVSIKGKKKKRKKKKKKGGGTDLSAAIKLLRPLFKVASRATPPAAEVDTETVTAAPGGGEVAGGDAAGGDEVAEVDTETKRKIRARELARAALERGRDKFAGNAGALIEPVFRITGRRLSFRNRGQSLRGYRADVIPLIGAVGEIYPGVLFGIGAISWLGVGLKIETAVGLSSQPPNDPSQSVGTSFLVFRFDLKPRFTFGPITVAGDFGFGIWSFEFTAPAASPLPSDLPGIGYTFLRLGFDARARFGSFSVLAGGAFRNNFSLGTLSTNYPNAGSMGFDLNWGVAFQILSFMEARATGNYMQISISLNPTTGSVYQAFSGTDQYWGGHVGILLFFGG